MRWRDARYGRQLIFKDGKVYVGEFLVEGFRYVIAVYIVNMFVIGLAVVIHYECLYRITALLPALKFRHLFPLS